MKVNVITVTGITHDAAEISINKATAAFLCRQQDKAYPWVVKLTGGYQLGQFDGIQCALGTIAELNAKVEVLNEIHHADYLSRQLSPMLQSSWARKTERNDIVRQIMADIAKCCSPVSLH
ncbi:hypothetical protein [Sodalis sp. C49]|uniref:hypothetical protein n=1 Tax=Sodalis sp. C49 TaxID=3228929 RepID=UPI003965AAB8